MADGHYRRMSFAIAKRLGLTRDDRLGLASMILLRDIESWKPLTEADFQRLADALRGYELIDSLLDQGAF